MKRRRYNIVVLFCLVLLFLAPGISAFLFYKNPTWLGEETTNKGHLLTPSVLFSDLQKEAPSPDKALVKFSVGPKWKLILWSFKDCGQRCIVELDKLARIRLALGRHLYAVEPMLVLGPNTEQLPKKLMDALKEQGIHVQKLSKKEALLEPLLKNDLALFIANPDNYLILAYDAFVKPDDVFHDIKQLVN